MYDWRLMSLGYFQTVGALCQLAHDTITYNLEFFLERTLFTVRLVSKTTLRNEIDQASKELISSMQTEFKRTVNILQILFQVNQYYSVFNSNGYIYVPRPNNDGKLEVSCRSEAKTQRMIVTFLVLGDVSVRWTERTAAQSDVSLCIQHGLRRTDDHFS